MPGAALTLGCVDFLDRTNPILERELEVPGLSIEPTRLKPTELLNRFHEFDLAEIPVFAYILMRSMGKDDYVGLPVFPHRGFPQGSTVVHVESGIAAPRDLAGRRIGTLGLFLSGTVWMRGILEEWHGVDGTGIRWVIPVYPKDSMASRLTGHLVKNSGIKVEEVGPGQNLSDMLEKGEIDAWIAPALPECFERGARSVRRLFPDYREIERTHASRTRFVPALHTVIMRRGLHDEDPARTKSIIDLFQRARDAGMKKFRNDGVFAFMLPWMRHHLDELREIFGAEWVPCGYESNRELIAACLNYSARQGLTPALRAPGDLFVW